VLTNHTSTGTYSIPYRRFTPRHVSKITKLAAETAFENGENDSSKSQLAIH
jgi:hypothetical protein